MPEAKARSGQLRSSGLRRGWQNRADKGTDMLTAKAASMIGPPLPAPVSRLTCKGHIPTLRARALG